MSKKFLSLILVLLFAGSASGASLWNDNNNWFGDTRPSRVGDIVTVLVNERTDAKDEATTELTKNSNHSVNDGTGILKFIRGVKL